MTEQKSSVRDTGCCIHGALVRRRRIPPMGGNWPRAGGVGKTETAGWTTRLPYTRTRRDDTPREGLVGLFFVASAPAYAPAYILKKHGHYQGAPERKPARLPCNRPPC